MRTIIYQGNAWPFKLLMERLEDVGYCTLCVRGLNHTRHQGCRGTDIRLIDGTIQSKIEDNGGPTV